MEFYRIWRIFVGYKRILIWLPLIATCFGLALTYVLPEQYESTVLVLVRPFEGIKFNPSGGDRKEIQEFPVSLSAPIDALSKTYIEVIKSPSVAIKIVDALQLDIRKPKTFDTPFGAFVDEAKTWMKSTLQTVRNYAKYGRDIPASPFDLAVENIGHNLVVAARKDTYAFDITYRSNDSVEAAAVANMAAEIFLAQGSEAYRSEAAHLRAFIGVQLDKARKELENAGAATLAYKNLTGTFDLVSEYKEKLKNVSDLETTLAKAVGTLAGLKRTRFVGSPSVAAQEAEIAELAKQVSASRAELGAYPKKETQLNPIILTESLAQKNYEFLLKNYTEARVKESQTAAEIRIVSRAMRTLYPIKPVKYIYAGLSFAIATVLAIGWALFFESLNPRVRVLPDLDDEVGPLLDTVPVLGAIPSLKKSWLTVKS